MHPTTNQPSQTNANAANVTPPLTDVERQALMAHLDAARARDAMQREQLKRPVLSPAADLIPFDDDATPLFEEVEVRMPAIQKAKEALARRLADLPAPTVATPTPVSNPMPTVPPPPTPSLTPDQVQYIQFCGQWRKAGEWLDGLSGEQWMLHDQHTRLLLALRTLAIAQHPTAPNCATLSVMVPLWALAKLVGFTDRRIQQLLEDDHMGSQELKRVLAWRGWKTSITDYRPESPTHRKDRNVNAGILFTLAGKVADPKHVCRTPYAHLKHHWRDLAADIKAGRTEAVLGLAMKKALARPPHYRVRGVTSSSSVPPKTVWETYTTFSDVALSSQAVAKRHPSFSNLVDMAPKTDGEVARTSHQRALFAFRHIEAALISPQQSGGKGRRLWVQNFAKHVSDALQDTHSLPFWQRLGWNAIKAEAHGLVAEGVAKGMILQAFHDALVRASDAAIRRGAALVVHLLKQNGWGQIEELVASLGLRAG
jgi:hypothetical protein